MKTLISATDFSDAALNAAEYAATLTRRIPAVSRLILYHSCLDRLSTEVPLTDERYYAALKEKSIAKLKEVKSHLIPFVAAGVTIEILVDASSLKEAIGGSLLKENPQLIVMGTAGRSKVKERIFGSQAVMAARHTTVPLLLVPPEASCKAVKRVVLAWDMKDSAGTFPGEFFRGFLKTLNVELLIINIDYHNRNFSADTIKEQSFMHDFFEGENVTCFYDNRWDAGRGIMAFAAQNAADWVIVIPKKGHFPENVFKPSMTHRLAYHSKIALLVLPPRE